MNQTNPIIKVPAGIAFLRSNPTRHLEFRELELPRANFDQMEREIQEATELSQETRIGKTKNEKRQAIESTRRQIQKKYFDAFYQKGKIEEILGLSSGILRILSTRGISPPRVPEAHRKAVQAFIERANNSLFPEFEPSSCLFVGKRSEHDTRPLNPVPGPNTYFEETQPALVMKYGYPFFTSVSDSHDTATAFGREEIIDINLNFFAAFLGGDRRLSHDVIFYVPEKRFYFFDPLAEAYVPTTTEKLLFCLTYTISKVCAGLELGQAKFLLSQFKNKSLLNEILDRAKALLATEQGFFEGAGAPIRFMNEVPCDAVFKSTLIQFVNQEIETDKEGILTLSECLEGVKAYSDEARTSSPDTKEIKSDLQEVIRQVHGKGLRNDLQVDGNRSARGWKGLRLQDRGPKVLGGVSVQLTNTLPDKSVLSVASTEQAKMERTELVESLAGG